MMNAHSFSAPELGKLAYEYLLALIDEVILERRQTWAKIKDRNGSYRHVFADLMYTTLIYSESGELGQERFKFVVHEYVSDIFAPTILKAFNMVDTNLWHGFLHGVMPFMLKELGDEPHWRSLLKASRTKPLLIMVDNTPSISEGLKDLFEIEGLYPDIFDVDITSQDSGAVCLIFVLTFEPDFMTVDQWLVGITGADMMWFIQQGFKPKQIPYFLLTANPYNDKYGFRMKPFYEEAMAVLYKPYDYRDLILKLKEFLKLAGFIKE